MPKATKIIRVTLDITLRPLTDEEIVNSGSDDLDDDCKPTGGQEDLDEVSPRDLAELVEYAVENAEDLWGGSNLYAAIVSVSTVEAIEP